MNYAIIDHAGSVGACRVLYKKAFAQAKGFEKVYTLKHICQIYSPKAREFTDKMKYFHRYNRNPKMVYIVCFNQCEPKAQFIANIWETRGIPVKFIEESPAPAFAVEKMTPARRCALIWSKAMGQSFSAPLVRDPSVETIDEYTARPHMDREQGSYSAKRFTNPQTYINAFRAIASEAECQEFFETYCYKAGYDKLPNGSRVFNKERGNLLSEFLEPGWKLCPNCGKPVYENSTNCTFCDTEFDAVETEAFWDDSYHDDYDLNYEARTASLPNVSDIEWSHAEASTAKYKKELPWIQMLNNIKFDFDEDTEHTPINLGNPNKMVLTGISKDEEKINPIYFACDPDGDPTIHQFYWNSIIEHEEIMKELEDMLKDVEVPEPESIPKYEKFVTRTYYNRYFA